MSSAANIINLSARDAAKRIHEGDITAETYLETLLHRYRLHCDLNTIISIQEASVLEAARAIDIARTRGQVLGPLAGVPFVVKDQIDVAGYASTAGTPALRHNYPKRSAAVVDILLQSGAIMFAKSNMHELASGGTSSNPTFGDVRNPYDLTRIAGGSSGGTAAALAARIVPLGLGEDTACSIRVPAGFCGVSGLRPSTWPIKRYADTGLVPAAAPNDTQTIGPMARTVSDVSLMDAVITGSTENLKQTLRGVRIGVPNENFWLDPDIDHEVAKTIHTAFELLREAGATLIPVDFQKILALAAPLPLIPPHSRKLVAEWLTENVPGISYDDLIQKIASVDVRALYSIRISEYRGQTPLEESQLRTTAAEAYRRLYIETGIVALAYPNPLVTAPPRVKGGDPVNLQIEVNGRQTSFSSIATRYTTFAARMGSPGLTFPVGLAAGLPVGLELEALPGQDRLIISLGVACEKVLKPLPPPCACG